MKILQSRSFERKVKKLSKNRKLQLDEQVKIIADNPTIGTEKKGDLRRTYIQRFKIKATQYLLAYRFVSEDLELIMIGFLEKYYRDLKKHIKST